MSSSSIVKVYKVTTTEENKADREANKAVIVTLQPPPPEDGQILFEIHVAERALAATDVDGEFLFNWGEIDDFPYQVQHR